MLTKDELPECPVATTVRLIGNKWKLLIIRDLLEGARRFGELKKSVSGISQKVLSENLRALESDVARSVRGGPAPRAVLADGRRTFAPSRDRRNGGLGRDVQISRVLTAPASLSLGSRAKAWRYVKKYPRSSGGNEKSTPRLRCAFSLARPKELESLTFGSVDQRSIQLS